MTNKARQAEYPIGLPHGFDVDRYRRKPYDVVVAQLQAALAREQMYLLDRTKQTERQALLRQEFEHRLANGLQFIISLLSLQSRAATTPEAAGHLKIAAHRVSALGRVHRRLHQLDNQGNVDLTKYLRDLCRDLSDLLGEEGSRHTATVEGTSLDIPAAMAIPIGFIVNELITNSAKHAAGPVTIRVEALSPIRRCLSVEDDGPGLPADFRPADSKGLGMKIVLSLVEQIGGSLHIGLGKNGRRTRFSVKF
jgi:two-component sensor histidine kinase